MSVRTGLSEALIFPLGTGRRRSWHCVQGCLGRECDMGQSRTWSPEVLPTGCSPRKEMSLSSGRWGASWCLQGRTCSQPPGDGLAVCYGPRPSIGSPFGLSSQGHALGSFLQPGLPACLLASFPSSRLVNCPVAQHPRWSFRVPTTLLWQCGLQAPSFFLSPVPCPPALPKCLSPPRRFHLPPNLPLLSGKIAAHPWNSCFDAASSVRLSSPI